MIWLMARGYNKVIMRKQMLSDRKQFRSDTLEREKQQMPEKKRTFNMACYPAFQNVRNIMEKLHILSTPNKEYKKVFPNKVVHEAWLESNHPNLM